MARLTMMYNWCHNKQDACQDGKTTGELVERVSEAELSSGGANSLRGPAPQGETHSPLGTAHPAVV